MKPQKNKTLFSTNFSLLLIMKQNYNHCYWCGQKLRKCDTCGGRGVKSEATCTDCNGNGAICKVHRVDWE